MDQFDSGPVALLQQIPPVHEGDKGRETVDCRARSARTHIGCGSRHLVRPARQQSVRNEFFEAPGGHGGGHGLAEARAMDQVVEPGSAIGHKTSARGRPRLLPDHSPALSPW
jgi:hypothetical protein